MLTDGVIRFVCKLEGVPSFALKLTMYVSTASCLNSPQSLLATMWPTGNNVAAEALIEEWICFLSMGLLVGML